MQKQQTSLRIKVNFKYTLVFYHIPIIKLPSIDESEVTTSFLMQLSTWDKEELDEKLANRVQVSRRAVAKIVQVFDRLMQRNEKITLALKGECEEHDRPIPNIDETLRQTNIEVMAENRNLQSQNTALHEKYHTISLKMSELQVRINVTFLSLHVIYFTFTLSIFLRLGYLNW